MSKYYRHPYTGYYDDYFSNVSKPVQCSLCQYLYLKSQGYRVTKAHPDMSIQEVHVKAQIEAGSHPESHKVQAIRESYLKANI